jgi:DNA-binding response OmpR family regulator
VRILAVDDDIHARRVVANILKGAGYEVETAVDGLEALRMIRARRPDLVILDAVMPGLDGFAVLAELRRMPDPPPVIGLTAISDHEAFARFVASGAAAYLCKPVSLHELLHTVRLTLKGREDHAPASARGRAEVRVDHMVGVRTLGTRGSPTLLGELKEVTPEQARVILMAPLEVGSKVRVILHVSVAGSPLGFDATVLWCAAGASGFSHGLTALQASKEAWDRLLVAFAALAGSGEP